MPFLSALQDSVAPLLILNKLLIFIKVRISNKGLAVFSVVFFGLKKDHQTNKYCSYHFFKISKEWLVRKNLAWIKLSTIFFLATSTSLLLRNGMDVNRAIC